VLYADGSHDNHRCDLLICVVFATTHCRTCKTHGNGLAVCFFDKSWCCADNIKTTAFRQPLSLLDQAREAFALHISSIFPANFRAEVPSANVIQDVNIRLFYDSVAEIMGHTYQTLIMHTILHTIPATNAIAVLWPADPSNFAQRVLTANSRTRIAARLGIINLREAPITNALGDCADSIRSFLSTLLCLFWDGGCVRVMKHLFTQVA